MSRFKIAAAMLFVLIVFSACEMTTSEILNEITNGIELTEEQERELVALGLSDPSGGLANVFQMAGGAVTPSFYAGKLDTSFSFDWVNYDVEFTFYAGDTEVPMYIPGFVDSVICEGHFTGDTTYTSPANASNFWDIQLNSDATVYVRQMTATTARLHGGGTDSSHYKLDRDGVDLDFDSRSTFSAANVVIPITGNSHVPVSGNVSGTMAGTAYTDNLSKDFNIPYTGLFTGNNAVLITLTNSGKTFSVNLSTGAITEN